MGIKKVTLIIALSAIMFGCGNDEKETTKPTETVTSISSSTNTPNQVEEVVQIDDSANTATTWEEGKHYSVMESYGGLENTVLEVFWYGCPHCKRMESVIRDWKANSMPDDYSLIVIPATPNPVWASHAALFYGLKALGLEEKFRDDVFELFSEQRDAKYLENWFSERNINQEEINEALKDEDVLAEITADSKVQDHYLEKSKGVPAIVVNGKYLIELRAFKEYDTAFLLVDYLIEMDRNNI